MNVRYNKVFTIGTSVKTKVTGSLSTIQRKDNTLEN